MGWEKDNFVRQQQYESQQDLNSARKAYESVANERLANAAKGEWSPWLAIKQNVIEHAMLRPAERGPAAALQPTGGFATGYSDDRSARWDKAMQQAEMAAEGKAKAPRRFSAK